MKLVQVESRFKVGIFLIVIPVKVFMVLISIALGIVLFKKEFDVVLVFGFIFFATSATVFVRAAIIWMEHVAVLKGKYSDIPYTFSFTGEVNKASLTKGDTSMLDFLEVHIWMVNGSNSEFYKEINYNYERFSDEGYKNLALKGGKLLM